MKEKSRYDQRGVSASKTDVHNAIKSIDKGIFPNAFCKIIPDYLAGDPDFCNIMHADGAGTKKTPFSFTIFARVKNVTKTFSCYILNFIAC